MINNNAGDNTMGNLKYIFVHGLSGWGSYDKQNERMLYWGMRNGDLMEQLRKLGYDCYSASVAPHGSAWDRACELYAQLSGTRSDYGAAHSARYGHDRYGRDFTGIPLIESFDDSTRLVLIGHSFGGATVRVFADILRNGRAEETEENGSLFFKGGMGNRIAAIMTLAAPHNGTTAYDLFEDPSFDPKSVRVWHIEDVAGRFMSRNNTPDTPLPEGDSAAYDMHIDNALALNKTLNLDPAVYYFSQPCESTVQRDNGTYRPMVRKTELLFRRTSRYMGVYLGATRGGVVLDERWRPNDGLVNTISSLYPMEDPHVSFEETHIEPGTWNVFETLTADHMALQGGLMHRHRVLPYYKKLLAMLDALCG
jgi:triacylglycerol lipase